MSRFLKIVANPESPTSAIVLDASDNMVGDFRDALDALRFASAVALAPNNPDERSDPFERRTLHVVNLAMANLWHVIDPTTYDRECVATFLDRADADLFVAFMKPDDAHAD
jgi:hypothetical protein